MLSCGRRPVKRDSANRHFSGATLGLWCKTEPLPYQWRHIVEQYCMKTFDKHHVVVLTDIATQGFDSGRGGKYLIRLWGYDLENQMC